MNGWLLDGSSASNRVDRWRRTLGSPNGQGNIQLGATTDGPSSIGNFVGLGYASGMRPCSAGHYKPFNSAKVGFEDNVVSWPSVEPADDYVAASLFAFALGASASADRR